MVHYFDMWEIWDRQTITFYIQDDICRGCVICCFLSWKKILKYESQSECVEGDEEKF